MVSQTLQAALKVYFEAKQLMYKNSPEFRFLETGLLKCFHKHPGWPEIDAFYAVDIEPQQAVAAIAGYVSSPRHMLTVFMESPREEYPEYAARGYRALPDSQPFMSLELTGQAVENPSSVVRVETPEQVDFINRSGMYMDLAHLNDGIFRYYFMEQGGLPVCRGRSVTTTQQAIYVAGIETSPAFRRRGLASALMGQMHMDALLTGRRGSVLCSSPLGLGLYQALGYTVLATMQAFVPEI